MAPTAIGILRSYINSVVANGNFGHIDRECQFYIRAGSNGNLYTVIISRIIIDIIFQLNDVGNRRGNQPGFLIETSGIAMTPSAVFILEPYIQLVESF